MRAILCLLLISRMAWAQSGNAPKPADNSAQSSAVAVPSDKPVTEANALVIPAGAKIPLSLAQAISTKNAREGDPVYASTVFPFVLNEHVLVPAGT